MIRLIWGFLTSGFSFLVKNPKVALMLAAAIVVGLVYWHMRAQRKTITKQATQITTLKAAAKSDKAVIAEKGSETKRAVTHAIIKDHIENAPPADAASQDGAIPAVLFDTISSLRDAHSDR